MNTWRVCAAIGLGLTFALASGCSSDSDKKNDGGGGRDTGSGRDQSIGRDTTSGDQCEYKGQTYQPGETFTYNCVRLRCEGGGNDVVQIGGSPCTDGGPDTRSGSDVPVAPEVGRADAGRDVAPAETGRQDVRPPVDAQAIDVEPRADTAPREDTQPPKADTSVPAEDTAPPRVDVATEDLPALPLTCKDGTTGQEYGLYVQFQCGCRTCECDPNSAGTGTIINVVADNCAVDAGG